MTFFCQSSSLWQTILLVISQFTVIWLAAGCILLFMRKCRLPKLITMGAVFLVNVALYILMQLTAALPGLSRGCTCIFHMPSF